RGCDRSPLLTSLRAPLGTTNSKRPSSSDIVAKRLSGDNTKTWATGSCVTALTTVPLMESGCDEVPESPCPSALPAGCSKHRRAADNRRLQCVRSLQAAAALGEWRIMAGFSAEQLLHEATNRMPGSRKKSALVRTIRSAAGRKSRVC